ncbi:MAG: DUF3667 domain-containing protein [Pseudomonadota bacterium]
MVSSSLEDVTSLNGRFLPTFATLLLKPGALSLAYRRGQWRRYLTPINVFLLANLVFFLAPALTDFNVGLYDQRTSQPYSEWVAPWIDARIESSGDTFAEFSQRYAARGNDIAKTLVILHVPFIAIITLLLFFDRKLLYADHVVTALHFFAFLMLYYALLPVVVLLLSGLNALVGGSLPAFHIALLVQFAYTIPMMKTAFGVGWLRAVVSTALFAPALLAAHLCYRFVQLMIVMALL